MFNAVSILVLALACVSDDNKAGALVPLEQGVTDRSATATSLRIQPVELSETTNFQKLFGVAGRPDLFVRSQGGLYAVFDQGSYRNVKGRTFIQWPSGTMYYIGQPNFSGLKSNGVRIGQSGANPPPGIELNQKSSGGTDLRIGAAPEDHLISANPVGARVVNEPVTNKKSGLVPAKDAGFGHSSAGAIAPRSPQADAATAEKQQASQAPITNPSDSKSPTHEAAPSSAPQNPSNQNAPAQSPSKP
jgi:hypothetical protein